jgi:sugar phosphate permease
LTKKIRFPKIFLGWWMVFAGGMLALWGHGFYTYGFSAFFKPIATELNFNRTATSVPSSIGRFEGGFEAPLTGWLTDRFGPRWIVIFGVFVIGMGLLLMNYIESLWAFYLIWGIILGTGINIGLALPIDKAIADWFVKKRGMALGIKAVFSGLSGALILPLVAWLIYSYGWREAASIGGLVMLFVGLPLVWFFVRQRRPEYYGLLPDGARIEVDANDTRDIVSRGVDYAAAVEEVEFTVRQAIRTPTFWTLVLVNACHSLAMPALNVHGMPFLTDSWVKDPVAAAGMLAIITTSSLPTRFIGGVLADRISRGHLRFLMAGAYLLEALGFAIFLMNQTIAMIYVWFILYGIGQGIGMGIMAPMRARYFGRKSFGSIAGISRLFMTPIGIAAPIYLGWVYDTTGSYISAFFIIAGLVALSSVIALFVVPPKAPPRIGEVGKIM